MVNPQQNAIKLLRQQEEELCRRLEQVRKAISVLGETNAVQRIQKPRFRADLLRDYLLQHPDGARVKEVPHILREMGFVSVASTDSVNWLYQLRPEKQYFQIIEGVVTLRPDYCLLFASPTKDIIGTDGNPPASIDGVNITSKSQQEKDLRT
jgi:hypothetical protein